MAPHRQLKALVLIKVIFVLVKTDFVTSCNHIPGKTAQETALTPAAEGDAVTEPSLVAAM